MNKKLLVLLLIALIPAMAFADFQLGVTSQYPLAVGQYGYHNFSMDDLIWGGEARFKISILQGDVSVYYINAGYSDAGLLTYTDLGLSFDILFLRIGAGIGPVFYLPFDSYYSGSTFWNLKLKADVNLGAVSIGLSAYYEASQFGDIWVGDIYGPYIAANLLIRLF